MVQSPDASHPIFVFDGDCVLCSAFFQFILRHDTQARFRFVIAQSKAGAALYRSMGLSTTEFETNLVIVDGQVFTEANAFAAVMRQLGGLWSVLALIRFVPGPLKNPVYRVIARNRYRLFGRHDTCMIPDADLRARFLPDGYTTT